MQSIVTNTANKSRTKRRSKAKQLTKQEMVQKMLADQQFIRESIQSGISFEQLSKKHGFKFATI